MNDWMCGICGSKITDTDAVEQMIREAHATFCELEKGTLAVVAYKSLRAYFWENVFPNIEGPQDMHKYLGALVHLDESTGKFVTVDKDTIDRGAWGDFTKNYGYWTEEDVEKFVQDGYNLDAHVGDGTLALGGGARVCICIDCVDKRVRTLSRYAFSGEVKNLLVCQ